MRTGANTIRRQMRVLELRARGLTQSNVGRELGLHPQSVARIERRARRNWQRVPADSLMQAVMAEYASTRAENTRARMLASMVALITEQSRLRRAEIELERLRAVSSEPDHAIAADLEPEHAPRPRARWRPRSPLTPEGRAWLDAVFDEVDGDAATG